MSLNPIFLFSLIALLVVTTHGDLRCHRIRNIWTLGGASLALLLHLTSGGIDGLMISLFGLLTGLGLFLPFYLFGGMAAGDVKLMAAVGALLGPELALSAIAFTLIVGGIMGMGYLFIRGELGRWLNRWNSVLANFWITRSISAGYLPPEADEVAGQRFPYALAIATGSLIAVVLLGGHAPNYMQGTWP